MNQFLCGALAMGSWTIGMFFLRFWRQGRDRLFLLFAFAFWALCLNWTVLGVVQPSSEMRPVVYLFRLAAFVLIIAAIVDKNMRRDSRRGEVDR